MRVQISNGMLVALIMNMVYSKAIGLTQGIMVREVSGDVWISTVAATLQGMLIAWLTAAALRGNRGLDAMQIMEQAASKWFARLYALVMFAFFLGAYCTIMITFVYHMMDYFLPELPIWVFIIAPLLVGVYGVFHGLEVIGRMAFIGLATIILLNFLLLVGSMHDFDVREMLPVFQSGVMSALWASRHHDTDWGMATMMLAIVLPYVRQQEVWGRSAPIGILYGGMAVLMWPFLETGVLSPEMTAQYIVSCMQMARSAEIGLFLHRYEMIMVAFFAVTCFVQIMMMLFCASLTASRVLGLKDFRPVVIPAALLLNLAAYWVVYDHFRAMNLLEGVWPMISIPISFGTPCILLVLAYLQRAKRESAHGKQPQSH